MARYFVWVEGLRGPTPQLWEHEPVDGNGKPIKTTLSKRQLVGAEQTLSLDYLAMKYPYVNNSSI
jgi:hypothetical protein